MSMDEESGLQWDYHALKRWIRCRRLDVYVPRLRRELEPQGPRKEALASQKTESVAGVWAELELGVDDARMDHHHHYREGKKYQDAYWT
jgi:hypothetical protein